MDFYAVAPHTGWSKKRIPSFIFGTTSVIQHRFYHSFTVASRNLWREKLEVPPPTTPLLCDHITLQNKRYC